MLNEPIASEEEWRKRDDARILARAEEIKADAARLKEATEAAKRMVEEEKKDLQALSKVARDAPSSQSTRSNNASFAGEKRKRTPAQRTNQFNVFKKV